MDTHLRVVFLSTARELVDSLDEKEQTKVYSSVKSLQKSDFETAYVKTLRGPIKELRVRDIRLIFCVEMGTIYFVRGFIKKTPKTPQNEIEVALKIYCAIQTHIWNI